MAGVYGNNPYGSASPFFNWQSTYGSPWNTPGGFLETPLGEIGANEDEAAYFQRQIAPWAGGNRAFDRFVQGQQGRFLSGLSQARLTNPNLSIMEYASPLLNYSTFANQWRGMDAGQRGERWGTFAPRTRQMFY